MHNTFLKSFLRLCLVTTMLLVTSFATGQASLEMCVEDNASILRDFASSYSCEGSLFIEELFRLDFEEKDRLLVSWAKVVDAWIVVVENWILHSSMLYSRIRTHEEDDDFIKLFSSFVDAVEVSLAVTRLSEQNPHGVRLLNEGHTQMGLMPGSVTQISDFLVDLKVTKEIISGLARLKESEACALETQDLIKRGERLLGGMTPYLAVSPFRTIESVVRELNRFVEKTVSVLATGRDFSGRAEFICAETVQDIRHLLQPGDVLIRRNNWQLTNIGIPGFWTHSGLYVGTFEELENFFGDLFEKSEDGLLNYLDKITGGAVFGLSQSAGPEANCVIEGIAAGVVIRPLENIAVTDYFAVLRPLVSREDKLAAIGRAFQFLGRSYDYEFDFATDMEMICSEVIIKSYLPGESMAGLALYPYEYRGKLMFNPNDFARVFSEERASDTAQFELVLFIDASEIDRVAFESDEESFSESWSRSRLDLMRIRKP